MSQPTRLASYESSWMDLADKLHRHGSATLNVTDRKLATTLRHRFYGFRNALAKADPENPYVITLMESRVTIRSGELIFERDPFGQMLRDAIAKSFPNETPPAPPQVQQLSPHEAQPEAPLVESSNMDDVLLKLGFGRPK